MAVAPVVVYHVWLNRVSGGVDVFFVISGFLLTGQLARAAERGTRFDQGQFFLVWPLLVAAVVLAGPTAGVRSRLVATLSAVLVGSLGYSAVLTVENRDRDVPDGRWPARWLRAVALHRARQVPGTRVVYQQASAADGAAAPTVSGFTAWSAMRAERVERAGGEAAVAAGERELLARQHDHPGDQP